MKENLKYRFYLFTCVIMCFLEFAKNTITLISIKIYSIKNRIGIYLVLLRAESLLH